MKGLVIREPWIGMILAGKKVWELRSKATRIRGTIVLIRKGSGVICGTAQLVDCLPRLSREDLAATQDRHGVPHNLLDEVCSRGWLMPWVLSDVCRLETPVPYTHPPGAVTWVNLEPKTIPVSKRAARPQRTEADQSATTPARPSDNPLQEPVAGARMPKAATAVMIPLTEGNLRNNHIYLRKVEHILPPDVIGGSSRRDPAPRTISVTFHPGGNTVETDVAGDKMILRDRSAVRDFFARSGAHAGDVVCVERDGAHSLRVTLRRQTTP